jgi:hypothetical protein
MKQQTISFERKPHGSVAPAGGYIYGKVSLGDLQEAFWSSTNIWNADHYERRWIAAAKLCWRYREPVLLYTDVTARASMAYHVVPSARELLIFEMIFRGPFRPLSRPTAARAALRKRKDVSCRTAPIASLRALAAMA